MREVVFIATAETLSVEAKIYGAGLVVVGAAVLWFWVRPRLRDLWRGSLRHPSPQRSPLSERTMRFAGTFLPALFGYYLLLGGLAILFSPLPELLATLLYLGVPVLLIVYLIAAGLGARWRRREYLESARFQAELGQPAGHYLRSPKHVAVLWGAVAFVGYLVVAIVAMAAILALRLPITSPRDDTEFGSGLVTFLVVVGVYFTAAAGWIWWRYRRQSRLIADRDQALQRREPPEP